MSAVIMSLTIGFIIISTGTYILATNARPKELELQLPRQAVRYISAVMLVLSICLLIGLSS